MPFVLWKPLADNTSGHSVATRLRRRRFQILVDMIATVTGPVRLLDIGGTPGYWDTMLTDQLMTTEIHITLLNLQAAEISRPNFVALAGDGRNMPEFADGEFDIVFSNSTIEHVGDLEDQRRMAQEVRRVGRRYYVQTPNRYFPIEPHFLTPGFQFLPVAWRIWLVQHFSLGWYPRIPDYERAKGEVIGIRLLTRPEVQALFPEATLFAERWWGLVKSFVAYTP